MGSAGYLRVVVIASLAGVLFGFDTAVIAGVTHALRDIFALTPAALGATVASALWGTLLGALVIGRPGDAFGSRNMLRLIGALYLTSALGCALAWNLPAFVAFRIMAGFAIGGSSVLAPVYLAEVASAERRGAVVGLFQINIVAGILLAYASNFLVALCIPGAGVWRWKLAVAALPALLFTLLMLTIPNSPRWLAQKGRRGEAEAALRRLGATDPEAAARGFAPAQDAQQSAARVPLNWRLQRRPIMLAIGLACFNQLTGINAILYYLSDIFTSAGFGAWSGDLQSVAIGATNLTATIIAMTLIDRIGRRTLLLGGSVGMAVALAGVALVMSGATDQRWLLALLILFIASFALSQGAVIWVYLSEIFPTAVRARGQSLGSAAHWIMNALITSVFPIVAARTKAAPFAFFATMMVAQFVAVLVWFPETRGVALERIAKIMDASR